uniref:Voltage-gated ion channel superfamily n=1 Tax=Micromonas pusilla TaxID=38833 RepID=A0A7S0CQF9_MICPS
MEARDAKGYDPDNPEVPTAKTDDELAHSHKTPEEEREPTPGFKRFYADRSLGYFELDNPVRVFCMRLSEMPMFDNFILLAILANAIILCQMEPLKMEGRGCDGEPTDAGGNAVIEDTEILFTVIFTLECIVKVVAMGFLLDDTSYLKDGWNVMDFTVVVVSLLSNIPGLGSNVSALRVIRVLRPLRTLSMFPGMRVLIGTMIRSVPMIANVMLLTVFFFIIFGIFGLLVFMGALRNRCFTVVSETTCDDHALNENMVFCREVMPDFGADFNVTAAVLLADDDEQTCTNTTTHWPGYTCPDGMMCLKANNPNYGITSFDNIEYSWLTIFQCITLEGWTPIMYMTMDAVTGWSVIYFVLLVFTGGFFLLNLALAVITEVYDEENTDAKEQEATEEIEKEAAQEKKEQEARAKRHELGLMTDDENSDDEGGGANAKIDFAALEGASGVGLKKICKSIIDQPLFGPFFTSLIVVNTLILSMEYAGMPADYAKALEICNLVLTIAFILELALKLGGLGFNEYAADRFNLFDAAVVLISIIELAAAGSGSLSALRAFRILRVLKLIRSWTSLQNFLYTVYLTVLDLGNFSFIVFLAIFIFALLGMQLFGGKMCGLDDGEVPRHNFDTLLWALVTVFQVLTGEDWNAVMYDAMRTVGSWACLYFIAIVVIGNYVVLNLFLAILLDNFSGLDTGGGDGDQDARHAALVELKQAEKQQEEKERRREARKKTEKLRELEKDAANVGGDERRAKAATRRLRLSAMRKSLESFVTHRWFEKSMLFMIVLSSCLLAVDSPVEVDKDSRLKYWLDVSDVFFVGLFVLEAALKIVALGKRYFKNGWNVLDFCIVSLGVASAAITALASSSDENAAVAAKILRAFRALRPLRIASRSAGMKVVMSALFSAIPAISNVALVCILFYLIFGILGLNLFMGRMHRCVDLYTNEPVDPNSWGLSKGELTKTWCKSGPRLITCVDDRRVAVFTGGDDFDQNDPNGFGWQCVSSLVPSFDTTDWTYSSYGGGWTCTASDATRAVLDGTNAIDVGSTFGSAAVAANDAVAAAVATAATTGVLESSCEPTLWYLDWKLPRNYDFDHIGTAMLVLFETATLEMWLEVMYHGVDATEENVHPWRDANPAACVFFVVFIIVGSFFIMNLFVGVTIDKFNEMKEESAAEYEAELNRMRGKIGFTATGALQHGKAYQQKVAAPVLARGYSGSRDVSSKRLEMRGPGKSAATIAAVGAVFVTEEQRRWQQVEKMLMQCKPRRMLDPPPKGWRTPFYRLTNSNEFDAFIGILITLNVGVMCMTHAGESESWSNALFWANAAFAFVFLIEACMKLIGFGVAQYFHDAWNKFDAFVVSLSIAGFALETFTNTKASYLAILRVFRVVRVLRLVKRAKGLQTLLQTLVFSLPALFNVASVLFLFFFIYAVMGMNLFGMVRAGEVLGRHAHFQNFPDAMATLFRSATGERWNGIMHDCMTTSECVEILTTSGAYVAGTYVDLDEVDDLKASPTNFVADTDYVDRCTPNVGVTVFYFVSFILLCGFVMLNLVIAVILDNFESYSQSFALPVSEEDFGEFAEEWSKIDRRASYYMKYEKLPELLRRIRAPLGIRSLPKDLQRDALRRTMFTFDVEVRDGNKVHFVDVLKHLASRVDGVEDPEAEERARSRSERLSMSMSSRSANSRVNGDGSRLDGADGVSGSGKRNAVHPLPRYGDGIPSGTDTPDGRVRKGKPSLLRQMSGSFVWRSSKKKSRSFDDDDLDDDAKDLAPPLVCHHFAAIHVQTMWKGKLARRQAELRKLKKKKRSMRRRKAEGQSLLRETSPASPGNPTSGDDSNGDESHDED